MKAQIIALVMTLLVASLGYFTYDTSSETTEEVEILSEYHWRDVNQFHNSMGSGYENLTNWTMNSTGRLHLVIDFNCFFDYQDNLTGYANISILEGGELVWSNVTSERGSFSFNYSVEQDSNILVRIRAIGSDTYPDNDFADWFVIEAKAELLNR